ncbi:hypothetical protein [Marinitenerispora sediminis]|uniref:hypothetical protein n=1 Tax=Marinitenerispora sediminis TaxID=1931232 RepID=UPI001314F01C|nr:hypothetical protein [Marinitenerispora sediminis]
MSIETKLTLRVRLGGPAAHFVAVLAAGILLLISEAYLVPAITLLLGADLPPIGGGAR